MKCEQIAELLADYLRGNLSHEQDEQIEAHMEHCSQCREAAALWRELAQLPEEQPSPQSRARFQAMLDAYQEGQMQRATAAFQHRDPSRWRDALPWLRPALGFAAALVLFVGGFLTSSFTNKPAPHAQELAVVQSELASMRQLLVLSMLQQQSASERLQGINWSTRVDADPQVLTALLHALRYDSNVGVRLAALDALSRHGNQPQVRTGLMDTLQARQSPLVQVAVIDLLADWRDPSALRKLQMVRHDPDQNPAVRQRAEWAIQKLD